MLCGKVLVACFNLILTFMGHFFIKLCIDFASLNCIYFYIIFNNIFRLLGK